MGGIGQIIGGALQGIGEGLEKQTILNEDARQKQAAADQQMRRDIALENLRHLNKTDETKTESDLIDTRDANHQARGFAYGAQENTQKQSFEQQNIKLKGTIDLSNNTVIKNLEHQHNVSEAEVKAALDLKNNLELAGQTVDHWGVTTDGKMVAFNKQGGVLRYSANPNSFVPTGESVSDSDGLGGDGSIAGERANRGGSSAKPQSKPTGQQQPDQARAQGAALAALGNAYAKASQDPQQYRSQYPGMFDAQGNLLPKDVLIQRVKQRYGG